MSVTIRYAHFDPPSPSHSVVGGEVPVTPLDSESSLLLLGQTPQDAVRQVIRATEQKTSSKQGKTARRPRKDNSARAKRYRQKKKDQLDVTLAQVEKLRTHVRELSTLKQIFLEKSLHTHYTPTGSPLRFVHEYFEVFRYGMQLPPGQRGRTPNASNQLICSRRQEQFMNAMVQPDAQFGEVKGTASVIEQWKRYSSFHSSLFLEFLSFRMDTIANCSVVTTSGVLHMRYSRKTLENLFPHVVTHEDLVQRLIGKELHLKYTDHFYFDEDGKVGRYELFPDMVGALHELVGNLADVSLLLGGAMIEDRAVIKQPVSAEILQEEREESRADAEEEEESSQSDSGMSTSSSPPPIAMNIDFILS